MFNRISEFQIRCSVDGNFANYNLCLIGFQNFRYAALLMGISQIITQDAGD